MKLYAFMYGSRVWCKMLGFARSLNITQSSSGVTGWVRNVGYDTVEAVAEGRRDKVDLLLETMKAGPRASRVDKSELNGNKSPANLNRSTFEEAYD